jgi:uncharacterized membrane protein YkoI
VLAEVDATFEGQVTEVELERDDGAWVYEVEVVSPAGNVIELKYDAATVKLIEIEGDGAEGARKKR